jgi:two-component sensor histidine kinase
MANTFTLLSFSKTMNKTAICRWTWGLLFIIVQASVAQPKPTIVSITSNGARKTLLPPNILKLNALDDELIIEWKPCDCRYRYRLEGANSDTVSLAYPVAIFTNLKGGNYTFWVQLQEKNVWSKPTKITLQIETSLVESQWFWPSVVFYALLLIGAGIYFFLLYNFRQKLKLHSLRNRIAADLHDEVGATLSSIAIATRLVEKKFGTQTPEMLPILQQIKTDSEESIQSIRDTVWTLNPNNDSVSQLFEKMRSLAFQLLTPQEIALDFNNQLTQDQIGQLKISMEQRQNIYLIFKEALNNILKHADANKVAIDLRMTNENELRMFIGDNGRGFNTEQGYEGNGLKNFKKRALESFMEATLTSKIGEGTSLEVIVVPI